MDATAPVEEEDDDASKILYQKYLIPAGTAALGKCAVRPAGIIISKIAVV